MKFNPCNDKCTYEGSHCQGCGRSHQEIANTKKLVMSIVSFIKSQNYENSEEFVNTIRVDTELPETMISATAMGNLNRRGPALPGLT